MNKFVLYVLLVTGAFVGGAASVLLVDEVRQERYNQNLLDNLQSDEQANLDGAGDDGADSDSQDEPADAQEVPQQETPSAPIVSQIIPNLDQISFVGAASVAAPAVVNIYTSRPQEPDAFFSNPFFEFERFFGPESTPRQEGRQARSLGSGVIIDSDGYIITNHHVIDGADNIIVAFADGRRAEAEIIGSDPATDLAVMRVAMEGLPSLRYGSTEDILVGDWVLAIGNPYGVGQTVTQGIVSALGRSGVGIATYENFIQTDAAINPGNSGGALVNTKGELWGINTAIFSRSGGSQGIGFAIPVDVVLDVFEQLRNEGSVIRGWLGVLLNQVIDTEEDEITVPGDENYRVFIQRTFEDSPAAAAGLQAGDEIVSINGETFRNSNAIGTYIGSLKPGDIARIEYLRDRESQEINIVLGRRPTADQPNLNE